MSDRDGHEARVLLVDDRPDNLLALAAILKPLPVTLVSAGSGEDALRALMVDEFAVILLDVVMPSMDGFETAYHIKRKDRTKDVPIIFLTAAKGEPNLASRGCAAGAIDYLVKPFDPWVLRSKVEVFIELAEQRLLLREQSALLGRLFPGATGLAEGVRLVGALNERMRALENRLAGLAGRAAADETLDDAVQKDLTRLREDVTALRAAHDALLATSTENRAP